jgi:hypothetical protein
MGRLVYLVAALLRCVSVVDEFRVKPHHRDTEDSEVAQRNPLFVQSLWLLLT